MSGSSIPSPVASTTEEVYFDPDEDSDDDQLFIDESSPSKSSATKSAEIHEWQADPSNVSGCTEKETENIEKAESIKTMDNNKSPTSLKPIQVILNRNKPSSHSTQTRYGTRNRSGSLPSQHNRYSTSCETPFPTDTSISLLDLAAKLQTADKKVNGKKSEKGSPARPALKTSKSTLANLKKKMNLLSAADEETEKLQSANQSSVLLNHQSISNGARSVNPQSVLLPRNGSSVLDLSNIKHEPLLPNEDGVLDLSQATSLKQARQKPNQKDPVAMKQHELECVRLLQAQRAKQKEESEECAQYHALAYEAYSKAFQIIANVHEDPDDAYLTAHLPQAEDNLPLWPLLGSTAGKGSEGPAGDFMEQVLNERSHRTRSLNQSANEEQEENVNSGDLDIPNEVPEMAQNAMVQLAINHAIRAKLPKSAKRAFEAAKFAAEEGVKNTILKENLRREKEARGFGPIPIYQKSASNSNSVLLSPQRAALSQTSTSSSSSHLIPVPITFIPVQTGTSSIPPQALQPTQKPTQKPSPKPTNANVTAAVQQLESRKEANGTSSPATSNNSSSSGSNVNLKSCPYCDYKTNNGSHLCRHIVTLHSELKPYQCYVCEEAFVRVEKCKFHMEKQHPTVPYDAKKIKKLQVQYSDDHGLVIDENVTEDSSSNDQDVNQVVETAEEESSENVNNTASALLKDLAKTSLEDEMKRDSPFACERCAFVGRDGPHLQKHVATIHVAKRLLKCKVCHYGAGKKQKMITHMKRHGEMFCFHCDFSTEDSSLFHCHSRVCSHLMQSNIVPCRECSMLVTHKQLLQHMKTSHMMEVYFCEMCPEYISDADVMERHLQAHYSEEIESQCVKCNETFEETKTFLAHKSECYGLADNVKLKCTLCSFNTNQPPVLEKHLTSHIPENFIQCSMQNCDFEARYIKTIEQHMRSKHKTETIKQLLKEKNKSENDDSSKPTTSSWKKSPKKIKAYLSDDTDDKQKKIKSFQVSGDQAALLVDSPLQLTPVQAGTCSYPLPLQSPLSSPATFSTMPAPTIIQSPLNLNGVAMTVTAPAAFPVLACNQLKLMQPPQLLPVSMTPVSVKPTVNSVQQAAPVGKVAIPRVSKTGMYAGTGTSASTSASATLTSPSTSSSQVTEHTSSSYIVSPQPSSQTQVYDEQSGGLRGHGTGDFNCYICEGRKPFKYRKSYEKHMYKCHQITVVESSPKVGPNTIVKIRCPVLGCADCFDSNQEVEAHMEKLHNILQPQPLVMPKTEECNEQSAAEEENKFSIINVPEENPLEEEGEEDSVHNVSIGVSLNECILCEGRKPFKYRKSYEKHMLKCHDITVDPTNATSPKKAAKISCPVIGCKASMRSKSEVATHMDRTHGIAQPQNLVLPKKEEKLHEESDTWEEDKFTIINKPNGSEGEEEAANMSHNNEASERNGQAQQVMDVSDQEESDPSEEDLEGQEMERQLMLQSLQDNDS